MSCEKPEVNAFWSNFEPSSSSLSSVDKTSSKISAQKSKINAKNCIENSVLSTNSLSKIKEKIPGLQILDIDDFSSTVTDITKSSVAETGKNSILTPSNSSNNENDTEEITTFNPNPKTCSTARINKRLYKNNKGLDILETTAESEGEEMSSARRIFPGQIRKRVRDDDNTPFLQWRKKTDHSERRRNCFLEKGRTGAKI